MLGNLLLAQIGIWSINRDVFIRSRRHGFRHGVDEIGTAIRVNGMVARMVGYHHAFQTVALSNTCGNSQHNAIAERHHSRLHVLIIVVAFRNVVSSHQQGTLEIAVHELKRDDNMLDAQALAVRHGTNSLATVLCGAIVESDGQGDFVLVFIQHRGGVHASRYNNHRVFHELWNADIKRCFTMS